MTQLSQRIKTYKSIQESPDLVGLIIRHCPTCTKECAGLTGHGRWAMLCDSHRPLARGMHVPDFLADLLQSIVVGMAEMEVAKTEKSRQTIQDRVQSDLRTLKCATTVPSSNDQVAS